MYMYNVHVHMYSVQCCHDTCMLPCDTLCHDITIKICNTCTCTCKCTCTCTCIFT